ncbi:response regulator [Piscirickettsia litoralis]|uniref:Response regulatory domain-containing protein n=1 Tax=Piscirickettsia litoralis TaxID=1891921 RepID=A0ABX3A2W2_9GAMM|nr:response regulator [Piscirickettsia litoralis]ODN41720.1 hypothetical protein BGC07_00370 [Piscirickettsia litoralis]
MSKPCLNLLLVEDSTEDQMLVKLALKKVIFPYNLIIKSDGEQALEHLINNKNPENAMLLDINLPKINGFELLETIQQIHQGSHYKPIYTVIFTTSKSNADKKRAESLSVDGYFEKPDQLQYYIDLLNNIYQKIFTD